MTNLNLYVYGEAFMGRENIEEVTKRRLYAESMGRCMNPDCQVELLKKNGDIIEKAHIVPYCETADNEFENLVVLCPNCHTDFDKNHAFTPEQVKEWKRIRKEELERVFSKKFATFEELKKEVVPILSENKAIYENYYINDQKDLWDKFECRILANNRKLKKLFENNLDLIQRHRDKEYSNLELVQVFISHIDEFEATRSDEEKSRQVLFPSEINSIFGISPVKDYLLPMTESLEKLIEILNVQGKFVTAVIGIDSPYIQIKDDEGYSKVFLDDTPRLRQLYFDYDCFKSAIVRFDSLNFALKYIKSRKVEYRFLSYNNFREIIINDTTMVFVYKYCLSEADLLRLSPEENTIIVNLHNWNGKTCISKQAYELSRKMNVRLLTMDDFYVYINGIKNK